MIVITAQTYNGQPVSGPSTSFDELGGTIGRAETNQLVLPDPERSVSRVHARLELRLGQWVLIDQGSNPVLLNGRPLGHGHEAPIADGDTLTIGGYELRVASAQRATRSDPFADLFGDAAATAPAAPATPAPSPRAAAPAWPSPTERTAMPGPAAPSTSSHAALIPEDWDPFAAPAPAAAAAGGPEPPPQAPPAAADSLDALFGLGPPGGDPLAQSPLAAPPAQPNTSRHADALRSLGSGPAPVAPPASDHVPDLRTAWAPSAAAAAEPPRTAGSPQGAVLSWQQPPRATATPAPPAAGTRADEEPGALTQILPRAEAASSPPEAPAAPAPLTGMAVAAPAPPAPEGTSADAAAADHGAPRAPAPNAWPAGADELQQAFADGLGLPVHRLRSLDVEQARRLGVLLREATRGVTDLLQARTSLKREMRAEVTMIAARENNPLKFSPNADAALLQLLGEPVPGFMAADAAMRDAFDDLRAHQIGVMAGMRAALEGVLARFDPAQLESRIAPPGGLAQLLPSSRKAKLWEQFQTLYQQISREAADDFDELFGRAFREAYEAQLDELQRPPE